MKAGNLYFFTASILDWVPLLRKKEFKEIILDSLNYLVRLGKVKVFAFVIMPNHIHLIWKIQEDVCQNIQLSFMRFTSQKLKFTLQDNYPLHLERFKVDKKDRKYQFWQRNPLAVMLYTRKILEQKLDYIHTNPLQERWNLAKFPEEYYYSSAAFYQKDLDRFGFLTHYMEEFG